MLVTFERYGGQETGNAMLSLYPVHLFREILRASSNKLHSCTCRLRFGLEDEGCAQVVYRGYTHLTIRIEG